MLKVIDDKRMVSLRSELTEKSSQRKGMDKAVAR